MSMRAGAVVFAVFAIRSVGQSDAVTTPPGQRHPSLLRDALLGPEGKAVTFVFPGDVPGIAMVRERLQSPSCAGLFGKQNPAEMLDHIEYYSLPEDMPSGEQRSDGTVALLYAESHLEDPDRPRMVFFQSHKTPEQVRVTLPSGDIATLDSIPLFQRVMGLLPGLTAEKLQAILFFHELLHQTYVGLDDGKCWGLSCYNTKKVIDACFPETIDQRTRPLPALHGFNDAPPKVCADCHVNRTGKVQRTTPTRRAAAVPQAQPGPPRKIGAPALAR